ncbi:MAG TPA: cache domain-containing protein, partial [Myxococcales bacterium]|nr:cache domain-containing protein [Myxococcales bacterium]
MAAKIVILAVGLSGALAAGLTWLGYSKAAAGLRAKSELALGGESLLVTTLIDNWLDQRLTSLRGIATLRCVRTVLETAVSLARDDVDATNLALSDIAVLAPEIESIDVIDLRGGTIASTTDEAPTKDVLERPEIRSAMAGRDFVSGVLLSPSSHAPAIYTSVPVRGSNGTVIGIVRARETIDRLQKLIAASRTRVGPIAEGVLLDREGVVVATTVDAQWVLHPVAAEAAELRDLRDTKSRRVFAWTVSGEQHVAVAEPSARAHWTYAAALPLAYVEGDARSFLRRAIMGALVGLTMAAILALVLARRTVGAVH